MRHNWYVLLTLVFVAVVFVAAPRSAFADSPDAPVTPVNASADGLALKGYDPVAYFTAGEPKEGLEAYSFKYKGATYRFTSDQNLELFKANPEKYAPQYGGFCAYAMAINRIADISPKRWAIVEDKLYLNNNFFSQTLWSLNEMGNIRSADRNWAELSKAGDAR